MVAADYDERYAEWFPSDLPKTELTHHEQACFLHLEQLCSQDDVAALVLEFVRAQVSCAARRVHTLLVADCQTECSAID